MMNGINSDTLSAIASAANAHPLTKPMGIALSKHNIKDITFSNAGLPETAFHFSVSIKTLPVADQKHSGRCWLFAGLNILREEVAKQLNLEQFELSQNHTAFWDKFEKINYFYETMIELAGRPLDDRLVTYLMSSGINDGGQWDMFVNVVKKYGVVPKDVMPETFQSSNTRAMNRIINSMMRKGALQLRKAAAENGDVEAVRRQLMTDAYRLLVMCFGEPPAVFDFEYTDKEDVYHIDRALTAKAFYEKYIGRDLAQEEVGIIHSPTQDKPYYQTCTIDYLGNVAEGRPVTYLNLPMEEMKDLIIRQLKDGLPVWFGSDVGFFGERDMGMWADQLFGIQSALDLDCDMTKEEQLNVRESSMNHAMVITGVNLDEQGIPNRWKIENSWGGEHGQKGYYVMTDSWFDRFVYQAVVKRTYLNEAQAAALEKEPLHFLPWDPLGTLA